MATGPQDGPGAAEPVSAAARYRMRLRRRRLLWRSFRSRHALALQADRTGQIRPGQVLAFVTLRNESARLGHFLAHYRRLGVGHFLVVDNGSTDGTRERLLAEPDVSLWQTRASYRSARFGLDWLTWLLMRYGHGHWCLTLDADELLIYPHWPERDLVALTAHLDSIGQPAMGALMLDMVPQGPLADVRYVPGSDPLEVLPWFDAGPWRSRRQYPAQNLWVQGGTRERVFFADAPQLAPTLNKLPLVRWNRRYAYMNSTHSILPPRLNQVYQGPRGSELSGVLLHTKFLDLVIDKAREEKQRGQHFGRPGDFGPYYDALAANPVLWAESSLRYEDWRQLEALGLMARGGWA